MTRNAGGMGKEEEAEWRPQADKGPATEVWETLGVSTEESWPRTSGKSARQFQHQSFQ